MILIENSYKTHNFLQRVVKRSGTGVNGLRKNDIFCQIINTKFDLGRRHTHRKLVAKSKTFVETWWLAILNMRLLFNNYELDPKKRNFKLNILSNLFVWQFFKLEMPFLSNYNATINSFSVCQFQSLHVKW